MNKFNAYGRRLLAITGIVLLAALLVAATYSWPPTVQAFEGRGGDTVVIKAGEVIDDDLYVAANQFTLDGTVKGDLVVVGSTIEINGTVEGDLIAAGQSIIINGTVGDDARIAGFALTVGGKVVDDLISAGFSLDDKSGASVGGDLLFGGYQIVLAGDVTQDATLAGGAAKIAGAIGGNAEVNVGGTEPQAGTPPMFFFPNMPAVPSVPVGLTIDEGAHIGGNLKYTANHPATIPGGVVGGEVAFTQYVPEVRPQAGPHVEVKGPSPAVLVARWFLGQVRYLITLLLIGAFMMWVVPGWTRKIAHVVETQPWPSLGWGVVAFAAFLVLMVALLTATIFLAIVFGIVTLGGLAGRFVALGGIVMSVTAFAFSITWAYVTRIVVSLLLGQLIFRLFRSPAARHHWWPMLAGVVVFVIITAIPVLGWLATAAAILFGLGAIWLWARDWLQSRKPAPAVAEAEVPASQN